MSTNEKQFDNFKEFFKSKSVQFNQPFPKSAIDTSQLVRNVEIDYLIKNKDRLFTFFPTEYQNFLNLDNRIIELIEYLKTKNFKKQRNCQKFISFTDIYNNIPIFKKPYMATYSSYMINQWTKYRDEILEHSKSFTCSCFLDIENYYSSIYLHFLISYGIDNIHEFKRMEEMENNERDSLFGVTEWKIFKFHNDFKNHLAYNKQTKGIPIGNGISDFISEMLLQVIEWYLDQETNDLEYKILRFRDDIFIFSNDKNTIDKVFNKLRRILLIFKLFINTTKIKFAYTNETTQQIVSERCYIKEKQYLDSVLKVGLLTAINSYSVKYPDNNKIFTLLTKLYKNIDKYNPLPVYSTLLMVYKNSKTAVIPMITGIIDKIQVENKSERINNFINELNLTKATTSDLIWLNCLAVKNGVVNEKLTTETNLLTNDIKNIIKNIKITEETDLFADANTFFYE